MTGKDRKRCAHILSLSALRQFLLPANNADFLPILGGLSYGYFGVS